MLRFEMGMTQDIIAVGRGEDYIARLAHYSTRGWCFDDSWRVITDDELDQIAAKLRELNAESSQDQDAAGGAK